MICSPPRACRRLSALGCFGQCSRLRAGGNRVLPGSWQRHRSDSAADLLRATRAVFEEPGLRLVIRLDASYGNSHARWRPARGPARVRPQVAGLQSGQKRSSANTRFSGSATPTTSWSGPRRSSLPAPSWWLPILARWWKRSSRCLLSWCAWETRFGSNYLPLACSPASCAKPFARQLSSFRCPTQVCRDGGSHALFDQYSEPG